MKRFYLVFMIVGCLCMQAHPFYVSVLEIHRNAQTGKYECAMKLFTDDLELAIQMHSGYKGLNLGGQTEHPDADSVVWAFVHSHFEIETSAMKSSSQSKKNPLSENNGILHFVGKEGNVDAQWIYFEFEWDGDPQKTIIRWNSFIGLLPGQKNILHLHTGNKVKTYIFDKKNMHIHIPLKS